MQKLLDLRPSKEEFLDLLNSNAHTLGKIFVDDWAELLSEIYGNDISTYPICQRKLNIFINISWERINIGHWKNVPDGWRIAYSCSRILNAFMHIQPCIDEINSSALKMAIKDIDMALILGIPIFTGMANKVAKLIQEMLFNLEGSICTSIRHIQTTIFDVESVYNLINKKLILLERYSKPSIECFSRLLKVGKPFILTGSMNSWPAFTSQEHQWSLYYLSKVAGFRTVPIELGSKYTDSEWGQKLMTINDFIKNYILNQNAADKIGYLAQHQLFLQIPELFEDLVTPDYCFCCTLEDNNGEVDSNIWFGPSGTISPLHHDGEKANLLAQISGSKYVILYTYEQTASLYPCADEMLQNTSQVDAEHPDPSLYPKFEEAFGFHGILNAGEMLFIPPSCWHYIRSLSTSISVNFWWNLDKSLFTDPVL
ncbi:unnamed protein product [Protopolystoma xenopodis]|uniref:JmjC domain-containing protein n=1 Tax=Protopolystoma xenopodis TaxID=117903 RepID=A0A448WQA6_9PLAT|nr:unnamed protein product [Protopolystoma xenopodis]